MRQSIRCISVAIVLATISFESYSEILEIDLPANHISYSSLTGMLYATIPSSAGSPYGNGLVEISPADASVVDHVYVGSEPNPLAISPDSPIAYVGLDGSDAVRLVDLSSLTAGIQFGLGNDPSFGPYHAQEIAVMPGTPASIAVSLIQFGGDGNVAIFDSGVMRGSINPNVPYANAIAFGPSATSLFGYDNYSSSFGLTAYTIDPSGISSFMYASQVITGFGVTFVVDNSILYATSGAVVDGASLQLMGTYNLHGPVVVDHSTHSVMFVRQTAVQVFDRDTFVPLFSLPIAAATGSPISATGCGSSCLAVVFDSGQIFVIPHVSDTVFSNGFD